MMRRPLPRFAIARLRRLHACREGVALTEFAFALPILLTLLLGGLEISNYALAHMRVNQIAMTVADNAGRIRTAVDESNIYEVFAGAELTGRSIDFAPRGRVVLSSLQVNKKTGSNAGQMINWQRCYGDLTIGSLYGVEKDGETNSSLRDGMGPAGNQIVSAPDTAVMFVEVTYDYRPLISGNLLGPSRIRYESAFNVRERTNQDITNTQGLTRNLC